LAASPPTGSSSSAGGPSLLEAGAGRVAALDGLPPGTARQALALAAGHAAAGRRLVLREWNRDLILEGDAAPLVEEAGFRREMLDYVWVGGAGQGGGR